MQTATVKYRPLEGHTVLPPSTSDDKLDYILFIKCQRIQGTVSYGTLYFENKTILPSNEFSFKKPQEIIKFYTKNLISSTTEIELSKYYHLRGCVYFDIGNLEASLNDFKEALKYDKNNIWLYYDISDVYHANLNFEQLYKMSIKCIKLNKKFPYSNSYFHFYFYFFLVYLNLSMYYLQIKNFEEALKYCKICQELSPNYLD